MVARLNAKSAFLRERILTQLEEVFRFEIASNSLIDTGLRIYDRDAEVGKEQGLSRSLVFANGLRFSCNRQLYDRTKDEITLSEVERIRL